MPGGIPDVWHPWFFPERKLAQELKPGDIVDLLPSTLDFEFLSAAGDRFEIAYDDTRGQRRTPNRAHRPILLDRIDDLERVWRHLADANGVHNAQVAAFAGWLTDRRDAWGLSEADLKSPFWYAFVEDALAELEWRQRLSKGDLAWLAQRGQDGLLLDSIELHTKILKQSTARSAPKEASKHEQPSHA